MRKPARKQAPKDEKFLHFSVGIEETLLQAVADGNRKAANFVERMLVSAWHTEVAALKAEGVPARILPRA